ncbi:hypothetical protein ColLi_09109 [Colletotrichum liriopes]|uniref:Uncharacterized protein n=1 Tax=Colletotrichum liriopes TaxID=708192 RepID=A0AA37GTT9_9PEZI|nr:hypothetical protein ColLi_09109 [Colletotrichum liriopes]
MPNAPTITVAVAEAEMLLDALVDLAIQFSLDGQQVKSSPAHNNNAFISNRARRLLHGSLDIWRPTLALC